MRAPALAMLAGRLRGAEVRNEPETGAGPEGGAEQREGWRDSCREALSGGEERADLSRPAMTSHNSS